MNDRPPTTGVDAPPSLAMIRLITGFWVSRAIYIAAKLGVADLLKDEPQDIEKLAKATVSHGPSLRGRALRPRAVAPWTVLMRSASAAAIRPARGTSFLLIVSVSMG